MLYSAGGRAAITEADTPIAFAFGALLQVVIAGGTAALAAGYNPQEIWAVTSSTSMLVAP